MNKRVVFWTKAYNAEETIGRAIESVLNQTYKDFIYYVLDHGSKDKTREIINEYAEKDSRVIPLHVKKNGSVTLSQYMPLFFSHGDEGYFASVDADDEYKPVFLERTIRFAEENSLDMVFGGCDYIENGERRFDIPAETLVIENDGFAEHFPLYYKYATRLWGTLFSSDVVNEMGFCGPEESGFGNYMTLTGYSKLGQGKKEQASYIDVFWGVNSISKSKRIGLLAESFYNHYVPSEGSLSYTYTKNYFWWIKFSMDHAETFLSYYGHISKENENCLWIRYLIWIKHILPRIKNADVSIKRKFRDLIDVFTDNRTERLMSLDWKAVGINTDKSEFLKEICDWAKAQKEDEDWDWLAGALITTLKEAVDYE